ncbi:putative bifunctional diguanylate cyclase/phosphodiesterase [Pararhizobium mangrovi]|uniref:EAL domain-containing protein n=1 Tax=Pararhizobium mangrovi TaxID=2590452 RepID=A0A506U5Q8_9HYPH|nr:EAL domain-containing protein [Pararhizobium mangrovi]TPW28696.1 EAL domain-containing protein [Pararhizobium mangrovi]
MTRTDRLFRLTVPAAALTLAIVLLGLFVRPALALEPVRITGNETALDLRPFTHVEHDRGSAFQTSTAPGRDGIVRRIEVRADDDHHSGDWAVFALANTSDQQIDRLIVAPHFRLAGSRVFDPDLGSERIETITPSEGFALDRQQSADTDIFHLTLNPGAVVTFVAELDSPRLPQLYLWSPEAYKDTQNAFTLYHGIVLGIAGVLAVFLTMLFVVKGTSMLPAAAALAWAVLAYVCIDFGFLSKLVVVTPLDERMWRAGNEVFMATGLLVFLFTYLRLNRWHTPLTYVAFTWLAALGCIFATVFYDPSLAAGLARASFAATVVAGIALIAYLGMRRYDRAIMLVPTWTLLVCWCVGAWFVMSGRLSNDIVQPALGGGLVLIVLLMGFTVMQHAFAGGAIHQGLFSDLERHSLALTGAGDTVFDWDVSRDRITTIPDVSLALGLTPGTFEGPARSWLPHMHEEDRDSFRGALDLALEHRKGRLVHQFRLRSHDAHYRWFALRARPVLGANGEVIRCVGTLIDITEHKTAEERLLHDAVHDNLTGLPNRELFLDRLNAVGSLAEAEARVRPTILMVDIDRFKQVNDSLGMAAGDTILLTLGRRLQKLLKPHDMLARFGGDRFAIILLSRTEPGRVAEFAESITRAVRQPIAYAKREIILTASVGLLTWVERKASAAELAKDAELAVAQAKRQGGNRIEPFRPAFRAISTDRLQLETDLRRAIERDELTMAYQPIVDIRKGTIAGFEALMRWEHPRRGAMPAADFIQVAEECDLIHQLGRFAFTRAVEDLKRWQATHGERPVFVSVNLSSAQLLRQDLDADIRAILEEGGCSPSQFKLELTETLVMQNPQQAAVVLERLKAMGMGLALDDFGTGHSSLAYLTSFPFDTLKIDKALVRDTSDKREALMRSIIAMASDLDMRIVAEGVESHVDAEHLADLGCTWAQSYVYGAPADAEHTAALLAEHPPLAATG